jgi:hypothetical protein
MNDAIYRMADKGKGVSPCPICRIGDYTSINACYVENCPNITLNKKPQDGGWLRLLWPFEG